MEEDKDLGPTRVDAPGLGICRPGQPGLRAWRGRQSWRRVHGLLARARREEGTGAGHGHNSRTLAAIPRELDTCVIAAAASHTGAQTWHLTGCLSPHLHSEQSCQFGGDCKVSYVSGRRLRCCSSVAHMSPDMPTEQLSEPSCAWVWH